MKHSEQTEIWYDNLSAQVCFFTIPQDIGSHWQMKTIGVTMCQKLFMSLDQHLVQQDVRSNMSHIVQVHWELFTNTYVDPWSCNKSRAVRCRAEYTLCKVISEYRFAVEKPPSNNCVVTTTLEIVTWCPSWKWWESSKFIVVNVTIMPFYTKCL